MTSQSPPPASGGSSALRDKRQRSFGLFLRDLVIIFLIAVLVSFLIKTFVARTFYIPSGSMENTLQINDRILVNELVPGIVPIRRGDVVVFQDPGGWLPASTEKTTTNPVEWALSQIGLAAPDSDDYLVKRVIGLPGDKVSCCDVRGRVTVNGAPLTEPYIEVGGHSQDGAVHFDVTVPKGELWVMGDNRWNSQDSSLNQNLPGKGFVPEKDVVGRAVMITWPISHWTWLSNYPAVFTGAEDDKK